MLGFKLNRLIPLLGLLGLAALCWAGPGGAQEAYPRLVMDQTVFEGGLVAPGSLLSHDFIVKNEGAAPLIIEEVVPNCGCAVSRFDREIAPNQSGVVTIEINIYEEWAGLAVRKSAYMQTNDPTAPNTRLLVNAQVMEAGGRKPPLTE